MAEAKQNIDFEPVQSKDLIVDRQTGWATFTRATTWAIVLVVLLLIALKVLFG